MGTGYEEGGLQNVWIDKSYSSYMGAIWVLYMGGNLSIPSFVKGHDTLCDIIISKGSGYQKFLWRVVRHVMNGFTYIIYDLQNRLVVMNAHSHGAYMIFIHEFYNSNARKHFKK